MAAADCTVQSVQEPALCASVTSDLLPAEATAGSSESRLSSQLQLKSQGKRRSYKLASDGACGSGNAHPVVMTGRLSDQVQSSYFVQSLGRTSVKTVTSHTGVVAMGEHQRKRSSTCKNYSTATRICTNL